MHNSKNSCGFIELTEDDLQAVTGCLNTDPMTNGLLTAQIAIKSMQKEIEKGNYEDAEKDLRIAQKALRRVHRNLH